MKRALTLVAALGVALAAAGAHAQVQTVRPPPQRIIPPAPAVPQAAPEVQAELQRQRADLNASNAAQENLRAQLNVRQLQVQQERDPAARAQAQQPLDSAQRTLTELDQLNARAQARQGEIDTWLARGPQP